MKNSINYAVSFFKTLGLLCFLSAMIISGILLGHVLLPGVKQDINYWFGFIGLCWLAAVLINGIYELAAKIFVRFIPCKHGILGGKTKHKCIECSKELNVYMT